ncbi:ubiquitin domain-containing protein DSK2b-like isoform X1 [Papaver somniferum]|uniref:ubiquitin domain-containing protein DSK2b-like isoform X1 n=1 Tax=Papaver somniferum TaxID=3469 RepID=UPI000E6F88FC|nr:ubiquitin domain-containing protein DSK2b-like isoform X1 [Papaver somniferum]
MAADSDTSDSGVGSGDEITIHISCSNGTKFSVKTSLGSTVLEFKSVISQHSDVSAEQQRLIYKGRILKDEQTLESYGLQEDHTVHMVRGLPASSANTAGSANLGGSNTTSGASRATFQSNEGGLFRGTNLGASLLPGLRVNGLGGSGVPGMLGTEAEFEQVQQQLTQNPNMMREIMNMPVMQSLMNNPDLMRTLIMSNPQMRDIMDRNPELAHILNDPGTLLQTLEAARNPELMREMMRNTDRAMSNIESSPEGFNMLRRMYETVQEPLMNATTMAGDAENNSGSNLFASLLGNQGGPQDRDRSINPSTTGSAAPNAEPLPNPWGGAGAVRGTPTNTAARLNSTGNARAPGIAGLGGLGLPEMEQMLGGMQDFSQMNQLMQNPAVAQITQSLLSDPQYMNQEDLPMQQELTRLLGQHSALDPGLTGGAAAGTPNNMGLDLLMHMFGGLGASGFNVPSTANVPPTRLSYHSFKKWDFLTHKRTSEH